MIRIDLNHQIMLFEDDQGKNYVWPISSGLKGIGELEGSGCTPRGKHRIYSKIGDGAPINSVFVGRQWTGEIFTEELAQKNPDRDWILTRILQLSGLEEGFNLGGNRDSLQRYIYIHGTPDQTKLGQPGSKGCIRMNNKHLLQLFDKVALNDMVEICAL